VSVAAPPERGSCGLPPPLLPPGVVVWEEEDAGAQGVERDAGAPGVAVSF
jgi:hypothetical protein